MAVSEFVIARSRVKRAMKQSASWIATAGFISLAMTAAVTGNLLFPIILFT